MSNPILQASFTAGEVSPSLHGRVDHDAYYKGLRTCRNFLVMPYGGVINRPGTEYCGVALAGRFIPFTFSVSQSYVLEFSNLKVRIIKDGGYVVIPSTTTIVEITTPYLLADLSGLRYTQSADVITLTHKNYAPMELSRLDHHLWTLAAIAFIDAPFQAINTDKDKIMYASGASGSVTVAASFSAFTAATVGQTIYLEMMPDTSTARWEAGKAYSTAQIVRAGAHYYEATAGATSGTVMPTHTELSMNDGSPGVLWKYLHSGWGSVLVTAYTSATEVTGTVVRGIPAPLIGSGSGTKTVTAKTMDIYGHVLLTVVGHGFTVSTIWDYRPFSVNITGIVGPVLANGWHTAVCYDSDHITLVDCFDTTAYVSGGSIAYSTGAVPTYKWAYSAWNPKDLYPIATSYYQQRRVFAGSPSAPQTCWTSKSFEFKNFGTSRPLVDSDALTFTLATRRMCEIRHMIEISEFLFLTTDGVFSLQGDQNNILAPGRTSVRRHDNGGCSDVTPITIDSQALYVQEKGQQIRSLSASQGDISSTDLTLLSQHLFRGKTIVDWAYQGFPNPVVWAVLSDGGLVSLTYLPEQQVIAWSRHDTDGLFKSVACISEANEDRVYFGVQRTVNSATVLYTERLASRQYTDLVDAYFVDCGLKYDGVPVSTVSGLGHLEGESVVILADGNVITGKTVTGGSVALGVSASVVIVGLPITCDLETLDIASAQASIREKQKIINHVSMIVEETAGLKVGIDADHLTELRTRSYGTYDAPNTTVTGLVDVRIQTTWSKSGRVFVRHDSPLPCSILAIIPEVTTGGS